MIAATIRIAAMPSLDKVPRAALRAGSANKRGIFRAAPSAASHTACGEPPGAAWRRLVARAAFRVGSLVRGRELPGMDARDGFPGITRPTGFAAEGLAATRWDCAAPRCNRCQQGPGTSAGTPRRGCVTGAAPGARAWASRSERSEGNKLTAQRLPRLLRGAAACALLIAATSSRAAPSDDIRALVEAGQSTQAFDQCASVDLDADPKADLWCGVAAVDVGRAGVGVLALERYTLRFPGDTRARLELARAYFYAGDDRHARAEFEAVLRTDPPEAVKTGVRRYLDALTTREGEYLTQATGFVELGGGYDSNANAGVSQANIGLPVLGPVIVNPFGVQQGSSFGWISGGGQINHPVAPGMWLYAGGWGNGTFYTQSEAHQFNLANLGVAAGGRYRRGVDLFGLTYAYTQIQLDGSKYRYSNGVALEWRRQVGEFSTLSLAPQYASLRYTDANSARDADYWAVAAGYRRWWLTDWQPVVNLGLYAGEEHNNQGNSFLGRSLWGLTVDLSASPSPFWLLSAGFGYQRSDYDGAYPIIDTTRKDNFYTATAAATYIFSRNWSARLEYQYSNNRSNLELFEYNRNVVAFKVRYDFR
jgi:hypothetical protein